MDVRSVWLQGGVIGRDGKIRALNLRFLAHLDQSEEKPSL